MAPKALFHQVTILGLGLIGGSLALDIKRQGLATQVFGYNRGKASRDLAIKHQACDQVFSDPKLAVKNADLVVLATPVRHLPALAEDIASALKPGAIVTDVGSTKANLVKRIQKILPSQVHFIGGHPIAGTANAGMAHAELNLFQDRWWVLTPHLKSAAYISSTKKLSNFIKKLGAKVVPMGLGMHDETLAMVSHLPQMLAYNLVNTAGDPFNAKKLAYAGSGFKDTTRIAASEPQIWIDICLENKKALLRAMKQFQKKWQLLSQAIEQENIGKMKKIFDHASQIRRKI